MPPSNDIYARVTKVLVQALGVEEDDIKPSSILQADLGAESIDFIDIVFRLEHEFGIKIERDELFPDAISPNDPNLVRDGRVTDECLTALRLRMPYADFRDLEFDRRLSRVDELFTVELLLNYVSWKLTKNGSTKRAPVASAVGRIAGVPERAAVGTGI
jgi:acyl carrier protein